MENQEQEYIQPDIVQDQPQQPDVSQEDLTRQMMKEMLKEDPTIGMPPEAGAMNNRHKAEYPFSNEKNEDEVTEEEMKKLKEMTLMPTVDFKGIDEYSENLNRFGNASFRDNFAEKDKEKARMVIRGERFTTKNSVFSDNLNQNAEDMVNNLVYGDKDINIRHPKLGTSGEATGNIAIAKITSLLNIGEVTQVPLWHSGFWVTFKAPSQKALINLDIALANSQIQLGRETNSLIFSNYQVVFNRILMEFIMDHITSYTIKLPEDKQLQDYILIQDYYPLVLGLLSCMFPNGIYNTRGCANVARLNNEGSPLCDYSITSTLDPKKLLWVNRRVLTKPMLEHMSNRRTASMSEQSIKEYQKSIVELIEKEVDLKTAAENVKVKVTFASPTLSEYTDRGEMWVNEIIKESEALFSEGDSEEKKNEKIMEMLSSKLLGVYNTYVKQIKVDDVIVKDQETIEETLAAIGIEEEVLTSFFTAISKFITESAIAMVAIPSYTCPKCGVDHSEGRDGPFKSFIPLNLVEHFFVLSAFRLNRTRIMV